MHLSSSVAKATVIVIVLLITPSLSMMMLVQPVEGQRASVQPYIGPLKPGDSTNRTTSTRPALSFRPNPIGIGQTLLVNMWLNPQLPSNNVFIPNGGYVVTITKPDGTKDVITMASEPATAANWFEYVPDQTGEWKLKFEFLGTFFPAGRYYDGYITTNTSLGALYESCYYSPSSTSEQSLIVQQNFVMNWLDVPLPTDYWTRPGSINNRNWWPILGSYPATGYVGYGDSNWDTRYPDTTKTWSQASDMIPWVQAPNTAHVLWKQLGAVAGLIGGPAGQYGALSNPGGPSVIYAGRCYQTMTVPINGVPVSCAVCYDLRTGQIYYAIPTASPTNGVTPNLVAYVNPLPNTATIAGQEIGSQTWSVELLSISGSTLYKVNPYSGAVSNYSIAPLSGGTFHNQLGGYVLNIQDLGANATNAPGGRYRLINWTTRGTLANLTTATGTRIISNTSYARSALPQFREYDMDLGAECYTYHTPTQPFNIQWTARCEFYRLSTGQLLYNISTTDFPELMYQDGDTNILDHGKMAMFSAAGYFIFFDSRDGKFYRGDMSDYPWSSVGAFGAYSISSGYGLVFRYAYNYIYAYNWTDYKIQWKYEAPAADPFESPYTDENGTTVYSWNSDGKVADGKLYTTNSEHTPTWPMTRGWGLHCINITTGELMWKLNNPMVPSAIADGYLVAANSWDGHMYVIGKGKSTTTVTAPKVVVSKGTGVVIEGTVLDLSPAQSGTPCVSKNSMTTQMEYLHLKMPIDGLYNNETIIGVPVTLTALGSDGSSIDIGTVTTDGYYGTFSKTWTPPAEGDYKIIATFAGDDSYGSSSAETAISVGPAPATSDNSQQEIVVPDNTMTIVGVGLAVIIAVVIAAATIVLMLRKR